MCTYLDKYVRAHVYCSLKMTSEYISFASFICCSILNALQEHREQREKKALAANDLQAWQDEALEKKAWQEFWNAESIGLLHYSCLYGTVQIVKYFISSGVSPTTVYVHTWYLTYHLILCITTLP